MISIDKYFASAKANYHAHFSMVSENNFSVFTSSSDYFRSRQSGNWSALATWESSDDNANWQLATEVPTKDANTITIQSGHTVNVNSSVTLDQTVIAGILELRREVF